VLDYVDRNQRKRGLASASLKSGSMAASGPKREGKDFVYVGKVGTGFNRESSMEIRKKLDAILSSKSRLAKAPRLKGATWVLRADR